MICPACQGEMWYMLNDLGICDTCFIRQGRQRCLASLSDPQWTDTDFVNWYERHTERVEQEYGGD